MGWPVRRVDAMTSRTSHPDSPAAGGMARVGLRCDAGPEMGVGHVLRQLALAEDVVLLGSVEDAPLVDALLAEHGWAMTPVGDDPEALLAVVRERGIDVVMLDGYHLPAALGCTLRAAGVPVAAMVDGEFGLHQDADLYVDQNFGAAPDARVPADRQVLAGISYVLLRDVVRSRRRTGRRPARGGRPRVLCVFGGTDALRAAPTLVPLLLATGMPVEVVAVAATEDLAAELRALPYGPGQSVEVVAPVSDLPGLAAECDGAVSAAGSSIWEFFCLGLPTALVAVTDNQLVGYDQVLDAGLVAPLGLLDDLRRDPEAAADATDALRSFLVDSSMRAGLGERGAALVDGDGRVRVADAMLRLVR